MDLQQSFPDSATPTAPPPTMAAVVHARYGPPDVLALGRTGRPTPKPTEVLLAVRAAGMSRGVWHMTTGRPYLVRLATGLRRPRQGNPGMDVCGEVLEVGSSVRSLHVGQRVFGIAQGSFAEYAVAKAEHLAAAPAELTDIQAAVLAESGLTALQALDAAGVGADERRGARVLILGASGGVGSLAVALASMRGAVVTAACSGGKADMVLGLGAARVVDYQRDDPLADGSRYDAILDVAGGRTLAALRAALATDGTLVFVGNESGDRWTGGYGRPFAYQLRMAPSRQRFVNLLARTDAADLTRLADHARIDGLRPHIHATFSLGGARAAVEELISGSTAGKIAIEIAQLEQRVAA